MKKKILFLLHLPPPVHGSAVVGSYIESSTLINNSFDCRYINLSTSRTTGEVGSTSILKYLRVLKLFINISKELASFDPYLCYYTLSASGFAYYKDLLIISLLKLLGVRMIYHMHNKGFGNDVGKQKIKSFLNHYLFKHSNAIVLSDRLKNDIRLFFPENNIHICPNGIPDTSPTSKVINSTFNILYLSNLIRSKGIETLLTACDILYNKGLRFYCTVAGSEGDITYEYLVNQYSSEMINKCISFVGPQYGGKKEELFNSADIFVFPTYYHFEAFPLVNLEAMRASLPIISTNEGGIPDMIEEGITGFVIEKQNPEELASKIETLVNNPALRKSMGVAGRKKYEREFKLQIFENRFKEILSTL